MGPPSPPASRLEELHDLIREIAGAAGIHDAAEPSDGDDLDRSIARLRAVREAVAGFQSEKAYAAARLAEISKVMSAVVALDYSKQATVTDRDDAFDGFAIYLNIMSEELSASTVSKAYVTSIIESMVDLLLVTDTTGTIKSANHAASALTGYSTGELIGESLSLLFPDLSVPELMEKGGETAADRVCQTKGGAGLPVSFSASVLRERRRSGAQGLVCVARDLTGSKALEEERFRLMEAVQRQAIMVEELSAPLLPISEEVLVMPLIGTLDEPRSRRVTETLLHGIVARRAALAILDITGVRAVDAEAVFGLMRAVQAVRLIGAEVVLTGLGPETALALARLDVDLRGVRTFLSLERGVIYSMKKKRRRGTGYRDRGAGVSR
jgi:rsbT co-antagonist protein RsbR